MKKVAELYRKFLIWRARGDLSRAMHSLRTLGNYTGIHHRTALQAMKACLLELDIKGGEDAPEDQKRSFSYICTTCAEKMGGRWPKDHLAPMHRGRCFYCQRMSALAAVVDWDWPDGPKRPEGPGGERD